MVFYFSGTGNSLFAAERLDEEVLSIPQEMKKEHPVYRGEIGGIVCPTYASEMPQMVQDFLAKVEFHFQYLYVVMTYGMSSGVAGDLLRALADKCHLQIDYFNTLKMVDNFLPGFDMAEQKALDKHVGEQLSAIRRDLDSRRRYWKPVLEAERETYRNYQAFLREHPDQSWKEITFHVTDACIGCGVCTRVCPAGCIRLENGRPVHQKDGCQKCFACIQNCPQNAIRMSVPEQNEAHRYRNENVTLAQLILANQQ